MAFSEFIPITGLAICPQFVYNTIQTAYRTPVWWNGRRDGFKIRWWQHRVGSSPTTGTIKSKRYRCHWRKASGINRFRAFFAQKFTNESIDANHCFPLTGGIRTPFFRWLANPKPCGALFEAVIFKKGATFLSIEYTKFEASICWSRRAIGLAPFLFSHKFKKGTEY